MLRLNALTGFGAGKAGYKIPYSLRFNDDDSAYLSRTPASAGNRKTWTWSGWAKRGNLGTYQRLLSVGSDASDVNKTSLFFDNTDSLVFFVGDGAGATASYLKTSSVYRDPAAHLHIEFVWDSNNATADDRQRLYVNGVQVTSFSSRTNPSSGLDSHVNNAVAHAIGVSPTSPTYFFDGLLSEINFIDGQALDPSYFGKTDAATGAWVPKKYSGSYGTNGFVLDFKDATSLTTLGYDRSGNGNNWMLNNHATNDQLTDTPTNNFCVLNNLVPTYNNLDYFSDGNLNFKITNAGGVTDSCFGSALMTSGKWYAECTVTTFVGSPNSVWVGVNRNPSAAARGSAGSTVRAEGYAYRSLTGNKTTNDNTGTAYGATYGQGDVIGVGLDLDNNQVEFFKNGASQGVAFTGIASLSGGFLFGVDGDPSVSQNTSLTWNFGQRPYAYTPPTGFKSLCTDNLPVPSIKKPALYFKPLLYAGNSAARSLTGLGHQPDLVWVKNRSAVNGHRLTDSIRGVGKVLSSDSTAAESTADGQLSSFDADGFSIAGGSFGGINETGNNYVAWCFKRGVTPGFDIVGYTGDGSAGRTVAHSLGVAPKLVIVKNRPNTGGATWCVYHADLDTSSPANYFIKLNDTDARAAVSTIWNNTAPTSSVFSVGTNGSTNANGEALIAYLFAEVPGFSRIGKYTGNGSTDGPFVWCGFKPRYILTKRIDAASNWQLLDAARDSYNVFGKTVYANLNSAEDSGAAWLDSVANGFKFRTTNTEFNASGGTYIFVAFAEHPFKYAKAA